MTLVFKRARLFGEPDQLFDISVSTLDGLITSIQPTTTNSNEYHSKDVEIIDVNGRLVLPGLVESHLHLDKACIIDRCNVAQGTLHEAISETAKAKKNFTEQDVYNRAKSTLEMAIVQGTTHIRTHVEVDPRIGLTSFRALQRLKKDYAWAVTLQICVFPQEGLLGEPGTEELLVECMESGHTDLILGGCPYRDTDSHAHISKIFEIAEKFNVDIDFHLDFDLDPSKMDLYEVCRQTVNRGWQHRVCIGHATKLSAIPPSHLTEISQLLMDSGVSVTVLPSTDLFLTARNSTHLHPRGIAPAHLLLSNGVTCTISTNNVLNPFTPYGDCSLIRMGNLFANVAQVSTANELKAVLEMLTYSPARVLGIKCYGIKQGNPATLVVFDTTNEADCIARLAQPLLGYKNGRRTFTRALPLLYQPNQGTKEMSIGTCT